MPMNFLRRAGIGRTILSRTRGVIIVVPISPHYRTSCIGLAMLEVKFLNIKIKMIGFWNPHKGPVFKKRPI